MNLGKKLKKALWLLPALLLVPVLFASAALTGQQIYDQQCAGCHSLGTYDTSGSPNLLGTGSKVAGKFTSSHKGITLTSTDITNVAAFLNNPTPAPAPVAISTATLSGATVGTAYSQTLAATGGTTPYKWSISAGSLPAGLTLGSTGVISGTPTAAATSSVTVKVTDSAATPVSATKALTITVAATSGPLSITTSSLTNGTVGTVYSQTLTATGGKTPYTWTRSSGTLPTGLTLSSAGVISGSPTATATFSFTVKVTDSASTAASVTKALSIIVAAAPAPPVTITTTTLANGTVGAAYSQTLSASGGVPPYTWSFSGTLPAGIGLTSAGSVTGTPTAAGTFSFTARVADSKATAVTQALSINIAAPASTPMSTSDKNLFITNCMSCHTPTGLQNRTAAQISAAISSGDHGMGTAQLRSLSSTSIAGIARSLVPETPQAISCNVCHASTPAPTPTPTPTPTLTAAQAAGKTVYDSKCAGCHALGTYDTSGSPDLSGFSSTVNSRFTGGQNHHGATLTATDISNTTAFIALY